mgnify:CR=1 FL=1
MKENKVIIGGYYRHFKGNKYVILAVGRNSENHDEELVVYQGQYSDPKFGNHPIWIRPKKIFLEVVVINGKKIPRFLHSLYSQ